MPNFVKRRGRGLIYDCGDIQAYVQELESRQDTITRYTIHERDESLWRLDKYVLEEVRSMATPVADWPAFTSNDPRTLWMAIRRAVTAEPPRFRIKLPDVNDLEGALSFGADADDRSRHERFAIGVWRDIDEERIKRGMLPFQDDLAWHMAIRGGAAVRVWVSEAREEHPFRVALWDLRTVVWEPGQSGLECVAHHYHAPYYEVAGRYPDAKDELVHSVSRNGLIEVVDFWWKEPDGRVYNCVLAGNTELLKPTYFDDLKEIPVVVVKTFTPDIEPAYGAAWRQNTEWESIYSANAEIYKWMNRVATLYGLYLRQHAVGPYISDIPNATADQIARSLRPFSVITTNRVGTGIKPITPPQMAGEAKEFFAWLQGAAQRGGVPYSIFGQIPFELSGFAVNQLQGAVSILAGQVAKQMGWVYRLATDQLIKQFKKRGRSITVMGSDMRKERFIEEIKRSDLREKYYLEVEIKPELPVDKLQEAQIAQQWSQLGISPVTIMDEVLGVADPTSELWRIVAWALVQNSIKGQAQGQLQPEASGPPPNIAPPEVLGQTEQHAQFQPTPANLPGPRPSTDVAGGY